MMLPLMRVKYGSPTPEAPAAGGPRLMGGSNPTVEAQLKDRSNRPLPSERKQGFELLDDGVIYVNTDSIASVSEKKFGDQVCGEIMLNSGDLVTVRQSVSEVMRGVNFTIS